MNVVSRALDFYIHSNIHVALSVSAMVLITGFCFDVKTNDIAVSMGGATFLVYNGIRYLKYKQAAVKPSIGVWFSKNKLGLLILSTIVLIGELSFFLTLELIEQIILVPFVLCTILYMLPVFKVSGTLYSLRKIPGLKIFCIALSWAGLVVLFPLVHASVIIDTKALLFALYQFMFVVVLTLPFDIRDMDFDSKELRTIPLYFGLNTSKIIAFILMLMMTFISLYIFETYFRNLTILINLILLGLVVKASRTQSKYYAAFWVEGVPILWLVLLNIVG